MHLVALLLMVVAALFGPQLWAQYTFRRHGRTRNNLPGTGGELARHLLDRFGLQAVAVEPTDQGDHYDPETRRVRLSAAYLDGRSLTAIAVAAHEVGHAIQHHRREPMLAWRTRLVHLANAAQKVGAGAMIAMPLVALISRSPVMGGLMLLVGLFSLGGGALVHLVTLPVEWDASFNKALPILEKGNYLPEKDRPAVKRILRAAALTYVAASLASLLNLWRWLTILRR